MRSAKFFVRGIWMAFIACLAPGIAGCAAKKAVPATPQAGHHAPDLRPQQTSAQLLRLRQALAPLDAQYDPAEQMLLQPLKSPGYHTTITNGSVHPTLASLNYAVALLDTGDEALRPRAEAILARVISLQDQNPEHSTYGIWPWFLEEPLEKMSPPDWNWADFCAVALLQVALEHRPGLSADLRSRVDVAIQHAARSIQRRNVGPSYTNIAIMGSYVTLVAAQLYGPEDLRAYAHARWRRFYEYTMRNGAFTEYNSPPYTCVALKELARILRHVRDAQARRMAEEIYRLAWEEIARHFHPPTHQWAGPHSRNYQTLLTPDVLALIERATDGRVNFGIDLPSLDDVRLEIPCPRNLEPFFTELNSPREFQETFLATEPPLVGTTRLEPAFALGSVNRGDLWNQRRPLIAYWGTAAEPSFLRLRFLHDGFDFAAAQFFSAQRGGAVLGGINFATDGGDRHPSLDRIKNGTIRAKDLRARFEFGGQAARSQLSAPTSFSQPARLRFGELRVQLAAAYARFSGGQGQWESGKDESTAWLDVVLYSGAEKTFDLNQVLEAGLGFAVELGTADPENPAVAAVADNGRLRMKWRDLELELPMRPATAAVLQKGVTTRNGK